MSAVAPGDAIEDGLVARRLRHQCWGPVGWHHAVPTPDWRASARRFAPQVGRAIMWPGDASCDRCRAVVVDEALPTIPEECYRHCVRLLRGEGGVGAWVAVGWRGRVSRWGTGGSKCASHVARCPIVTAAAVDVKTVRSAGLCGLSPVVSLVRCRRAAVHAAMPQFMQYGSVPSLARCPRCCTTVCVPSGGPYINTSRSCPGGCGGGGGCG